MIIYKDYYKILEVKTSAKQSEINSAYRKLSLKYHPDKNPDFNNPNEVTKKIYYDIQEAHDVLSDQVQRSQYDDYRNYQESKATSNKPFPTNDPYQDKESKNTQDHDIFNQENKNWQPDYETLQKMYADIDKTHKEMQEMEKRSEEVHAMNEMIREMHEREENEYNSCGERWIIDPTEKLIAVFESHTPSNPHWCTVKLIEKGANVNAVNKYNENIVTLATKNSDLDTIKLLVSAGANSALEESLMIAIDKKNVEMVKYFVDNKVYVNYYKKDVGSPLEVAIKNNQSEISEYLIAAGADTRKFMDHDFLNIFKQNPIKFVLDHAYKVENAIKAFTRMEGQFHLGEITEKFENTVDCLNKLILTESYTNLNELCGIDGSFIESI